MQSAPKIQSVPGSADRPGSAPEPVLFSWPDVEPGKTCMQYRPDGLLLYNRGGAKPGQAPRQDLERIRAARFRGQLSPGAAKNMGRAFDNLLTASQRGSVYNRYIRRQVSFQLNMITLTVPDNRRITSKFGNERLLKPFLERMERHSIRIYRKPVLYSWKIELQARGQLHWHIITNRWISKDWIRAKWSQILWDAGLMREYHKATGNREAMAATRVESVRKNTPGEMRSYLLKNYVKKKVISSKAGQLDEEQERELLDKLDGYIWGCSRSLRSGYPTLVVDQLTYERVKGYMSAPDAKFYNSEFCAILRTDRGSPPHECITGRFRAIIKAHRDFLRINGDIGLKAILN